MSETLHDSCPEMRDIIEAIGAAHGVDFSMTGPIGAALRLELAGYEDLCIERIAPHEISVAHYYLANGDLIPDPDVVFLVVPASWVPVQFQDVYRYEDYRNQPLDRRADLIAFCKLWAQNLRDQGWLAHGKRGDGAAPILIAA